jgi:hypothetical protein
VLIELSFVEDRLLLFVEERLLSGVVADEGEENVPWAEFVEPSEVSPVAPALTPAEFVEYRLLCFSVAEPPEMEPCACFGEL